MTLSKTLTLPTGEVLTLVPGDPASRHSQSKESHYLKVDFKGEAQPLRYTLTNVEAARRAEARKAEQAEVVKALRGKRPPKPKRPEPWTAPEGTTLYFTGGRDFEPVVNVTSVSDTGASRQVYFNQPRGRQVAQSEMKNFMLHTPEQYQALQEARGVRDEHQQTLLDYQHGYTLAVRVDENGDVVATWTGEGRTLRKVYPTGFSPLHDPSDPEVVVEIGGQIYPFDTSTQVGYVSQEFTDALRADIGLVKPERLGYRAPYEYIPVERYADWSVLMEAYVAANEVVGGLLREAHTRAGLALLAYEKTFVDWKADVAEWEREWKP